MLSICVKGINLSAGKWKYNEIPVRGRELDAVDAAPDAVDVVERVRERGVVGLEREVHVADDERGVLPAPRSLGGVRAAGVRVQGGSGAGAAAAGSWHVGVDVHGWCGDDVWYGLYGTESGPLHRAGIYARIFRELELASRGAGREQ